jgi:hypothetical protein
MTQGRVLLCIMRPVSAAAGPWLVLDGGTGVTLILEC